MNKGVFDKQTYRRIKKRENAIIPLRGYLDAGFESTQFRANFGATADGFFVLSTSGWSAAQVQAGGGYLAPFCLSQCNVASDINPDAFTDENFIVGNEFSLLWMEMRFQFKMDYTRFTSSFATNRDHLVVTYRLIIFQWCNLIAYRTGSFLDHEGGQSQTVLPDDLFANEEFQYTGCPRNILSFFNSDYRDDINVIMDEYFSYDLSSIDLEGTMTVNEAFVPPPPAPAGAIIGDNGINMPSRITTQPSAHNGVYTRRVDLTHLKDVLLSQYDSRDLEITVRNTSASTQCFRHTCVQENGIFMLCLRDDPLALYDLSFRSRISISDK